MVDSLLANGSIGDVIMISRNVLGNTSSIQRVSITSGQASYSSMVRHYESRLLCFITLRSFVRSRNGDGATEIGFGREIRYLIPPYLDDALNTTNYLFMLAIKLICYYPDCTGRSFC